MNKEYKPAIYRIMNIINNKYYIGSSIHPIFRKDRHFSKLKRGKHENVYLQRAVNKYGIENFKFEIIEEVQEENLRIIEQKYLDYIFNNNIKSYNLAKDSRYGMKNRKHSEESKRKISISKSGKNCYLYGKYRSEHHSSKIVLKYTKEGVLVDRYNSLLDAADSVGGKLRSKNIGSCCRGEVKSAYNYIWKYQD